MALTDKRIKDLTKYCVCGHRNITITKYYKNKETNNKFVMCHGFFSLCTSKECLWYIYNNVTLNKILIDEIMEEEFYFVIK